MNKVANKAYFSTIEAAKILGLSRIAVFQMIKDGRLKAERFGRNYLIPRDSLAYYAGLVTPEKEKELTAAVKKILKHYGEALKRLGEE